MTFATFSASILRNLVQLTFLLAVYKVSHKFPPEEFAGHFLPGFTGSIGLIFDLSVLLSSHFSAAPYLGK